MAGATMTRQFGPGLAARRRAATAWRHVDIALVVSVLTCVSLGLVMIYSSTRTRLAEQGTDPAFYLKRQAAFVVVGVVVMAVTALVDYRVLQNRAPLVYGAMVLALLAVLSPLGVERKGQQASFELAGFQLQPSELAKVGLIVVLAAYGSLHGADLNWERVGVAVGLAAVPVALIYLQPDLGTSLVFLVILLGILLVAGAKGRHLLALLALGVVPVVAVVQLNVLQDYQLDRLTSFLDPQNDTRRAAYNLNQSKTAIGSGGVLGKGLFAGTQTNLSYVPEQHTDFIFTAVGEQLGLVGSGLLLAVYGLLAWRVWRAAALARDLFGSLICVGVLSMFVFQVFENVGMTMGIMPITGIPLPFLSYGGSSTLAAFAAVGLVLNVRMRRFA